MFLFGKRSWVVTIPEPCNEDWNKMTPTEQGCFCGACQKHLVDFTVLSDDEIIKVITERNNVCGRYSTSQLNREIRPSSGIKTLQVPDLVKKMAASVLLFFGVYSHTFSQQKAKAATYKTTTAGNNNQASVSQKGKVVITGTLLLADSLRPLRNHGFVIEGTNLKSVTDDNGNFKFVVNESWQGRNVVIIPSSTTKAVLDKREVIIPTTQLQIDTAYYNQDITLYRYPIKQFFENMIDTLAPVVINAPKWDPPRAQMGISYEVIQVLPKNDVNLGGEWMNTKTLPDLAEVFKNWLRPKKNK